jgi:hypothetical protein
MLLESSTRQMSFAATQALREGSQTWLMAEECARSAYEAIAYLNLMVERVTSLLPKAPRTRSSPSSATLLATRQRSFFLQRYRDGQRPRRTRAAQRPHLIENH